MEIASRHVLEELRAAVTTCVRMLEQQCAREQERVRVLEAALVRAEAARRREKRRYEDDKRAILREHVAQLLYLTGSDAEG